MPKLKNKASEHLRDALNAAVIVVFAGIILTFAAAILFNGRYGVKTLDDFFDGENHDELFFMSLSEMFYKSTEINNTVSEFEFNLFSEVRSDKVILGKDGYLFEVKNDETGYNFWKDCSGALSFTKQETEQIANAIKEATAKYKLLGIDYYIAVIPNSQTVYSDKLPDDVFFSSRKSRRLNLLTALESAGIRNYIDTTIAFEKHSDSYLLFNNTENSPTPLGAYFAYTEICKRLISDGYDIITIAESDLRYQVHSTKSRKLAQIAGVSDYIENMTVSLTSGMKKYFVASENGGTVITKSTLYPVGQNGPRALISTAPENYRSAFMFFFASSFGECMTEYTADITAEKLMDFAPQIYIQIIHENELGNIIDVLRINED